MHYLIKNFFFNSRKVASIFIHNAKYYPETKKKIKKNKQNEIHRTAQRSKGFQNYPLEKHNFMWLTESHCVHMDDNGCKILPRKFQ